MLLLWHTCFSQNTFYCFPHMVIHVFHISVYIVQGYFDCRYSNCWYTVACTFVQYYACTLVNYVYNSDVKYVQYSVNMPITCHILTPSAFITIKHTDSSGSSSHTFYKRKTSWRSRKIELIKHEDRLLVFIWSLFMQHDNTQGPVLSSWKDTSSY